MMHSGTMGQVFVGHPVPVVSVIVTHVVGIVMVVGGLVMVVGGGETGVEGVAVPTQSQRSVMKAV